MPFVYTQHGRRIPQSATAFAKVFARRLTLASTLVVPAFVVPIFGLSPAHAICVQTGSSVLCAADDTNGFSSTGDVTDFTVNQGVTVDDSTADISGFNGVVDVNDDVTGTLLNNGTIRDVGAGANAIDAVELNRLVNNGTIAGGVFGLFVTDNIVTLVNTDTIAGGFIGVGGADTITVLTNSGMITGDNLAGVSIGDISSLTNSGTITGRFFGVDADTITSLTNSGMISGGTDAISEASGGGDTVLTLNAGSVLIGGLNLGGGANTLNIGEGLSLNSTFESVNGGTTLVQLGDTAGHLVAVVPMTGGANNEVEVVAVDPSVFTSVDDGLVALTTGIGQTVQGRQEALRTDPALGFSSNFANRFADAEQNDLAAFSDLDLDGAPPLNPNRFWIEGFGSYRDHDSDRVGGDVDHLTGGLAAGVDMPLDTITSVGFMAGFAVGTSENEIDTQQIDSMSYYAGLYASTQAYGLAWDALLTIGHTDYDQERITANNLVAGGLETAKADFGGWFINPQVTMTRKAGNPLAGAGFGSLVSAQTLEQSLTLSYAGLFLDDYTETGTTNPLTLDDRSIHLTSARAALAIPFEATHADGARTTLRLIGGLEARAQFGDDDVSGTLLSQSVSTTLDDDDTALGGFLALSAEYQNTSGFTAYADVEGLQETESNYQVSASAGVRIAF